MSALHEQERDANGQLRCTCQRHQNRTPAMSRYAIIQRALVNAPTSCRYHGTDWDFLGFEPWGEPRCDSCKQPWRVAKALDALDELIRTTTPGAQP